MKKINLKKSIVLLCIIFSLISGFSCKKRQEIQAPSISFKSGSSFISDSAVVPVNGEMVFGIQADGNGSNITNFTISVNNEFNTAFILDSGMNASTLDWTRIVFKGAGFNDLITFTVMNKERLKNSVSLRVFRDTTSGWGEIMFFPSVIIGLQNNTVVRNFYDPMGNTLYFPAEVNTAIEPLIDICAYYDASDGYTVFSPGCSASETYYPCFSAWATKNYTAWDIHTAVAPSAFDACSNDSLIIVSYDEVYGKKKYKFCSAGLVIPFKLANNKKGLVKVISVNGNESGTMEFALKIQK